MQVVEEFLYRLSAGIPLIVHMEIYKDQIYKLHCSGKIPIYFYSQGHYNPIPKEEAIHIEADTWIAHSTIIINRIHAIWGFSKRVYARQTLCKRIILPESLEFQRKNHMLVPLRGKYRYGLYRTGELIALAVFSGYRKMKRGEHYRSIEMLRFCYKGNYHVVGGLSKLITTMWRELDPDDLMTYIDQKWSDGRKFEQLGFRIVGRFEDREKGIYSLKLILKKD